MTVGRAAGLLVVVLSTGCAAPAEQAPAEATTAAAVPARATSAAPVRLTTPHAATGLTLLEGPVVVPDGDLVVVDVTAPDGAGKVLRVSLEDSAVTPLVTDGGGAYTSAQLSPSGDRLYLTNFVAGSIESTTLDGQDRRTEFAGPVEGVPVLPDDLAFAPDGALLVSDTTGYDDPAGPPRGRVVRVEPDGSAASVLAADLAAPNGISLDEGSSGLWVSLHGTGRLEHRPLTGGGTALGAVDRSVAVQTAGARVDSTAVDAAGNVYQGLHGRPAVLVHDREGTLLQTVEVPVPPEGEHSATNVAVVPGTTRAFTVVSGPSGGWVAEFEALAPGTRQTNGG